MEVPLKVWIVMGLVAVIICGLTLFAISKAYSKKWDAIEYPKDPEEDEGVQADR